eukprot:3772848-Amphidinium_carterae.1
MQAKFDRVRAEPSVAQVQHLQGQPQPIQEEAAEQHQQSSAATELLQQEEQGEDRVQQDSLQEGQGDEQVQPQTHESKNSVVLPRRSPTTTNDYTVSYTSQSGNTPETVNSNTVSQAKLFMVCRFGAFSFHGRYAPQS